MKNIIHEIEKMNFFHARKPVEDKQIQKAEVDLNIKFNNEYKSCIKSFGAFSIDGHEITGICSSDRLNVVNVTKKERCINKKIPENLYVIECLDIDHIVIWQSESGKVYQSMLNGKYEKIADSLIEYLKSF